MLGKLKVQSSKLKTVTQILKVLKFLTIILTFNILVLSLPSPVYAGHCSPEAEEQGIPKSYTGPLPNEYCASDERFEDLDNCQHHSLGNCPAGTSCVKTGITTSCEPGAAPAAAADTAAGLKEIEDVFKNVIQVVVGLGFIASLIMLIFAGFKYLTSGGEPKAVQAAHQTFAWALLGILFLAVAWLVLKLVEAFTGIPVTGFNIRALCGPGGNWCSPNPSAGP